MVTRYSNKWGIHVSPEGELLTAASFWQVPQVSVHQGVVTRDFCFSCDRGASGSLVSEISTAFVFCLDFTILSSLCFTQLQS